MTYSKIYGMVISIEISGDTICKVSQQKFNHDKFYIDLKNKYKNDFVRACLKSGFAFSKDECLDICEEIIIEGSGIYSGQAFWQLPFYIKQQVAKMLVATKIEPQNI